MTEWNTSASMGRSGGVLMASGRRRRSVVRQRLRSLAAYAVAAAVLGFCLAVWALVAAIVYSFATYS